LNNYTCGAHVNMMIFLSLHAVRNQRECFCLTQVAPEQLILNVSPETTYMALTIPTHDHDLAVFPFASPRTHVTLAYELKFHGTDIEVWRNFWALKSRCQVLLTRRVVSLSFVRDPQGTGHTYPSDPFGEFTFICDECRRVFELLDGVEEVSAPHAPYHISWLDL